MRYLRQVPILTSLFGTLLLAAVVSCSDQQEQPKAGEEQAPRPSTQAAEADANPPVSSEQNPASPADSPAAQDGAASEQNDSMGEPSPPGDPGPFQVKTYTQGLASADYGSAMVFYPENLPQNQKTAATTLSGGYSNTKEQMAWIGEHLASHGFVVIAFTPTSSFTTDPSVWTRGHLGAYRMLKAENQRVGSPLKGLLDPARLGIMGFSMGGAGTLLATNQLGGEAGAAVALCPYRPSTATVNTPVLFVTGTNDRTAVPEAVIKAFEDTPEESPKGLKNIPGMAHSDINRTATFRRELATAITAWLGQHLLKNPAYQKYLVAKDFRQGNSP